MTSMPDPAPGPAVGLVQDDQHVEVAIRAGIAAGLRAEDEDVVDEARVVFREGLAVFVEPCLLGGGQLQYGVGLLGVGTTSLG